MPPTKRMASIPRLAAALALLIGGCAADQGPNAAPDATYSTRGEIARLPSASQSEMWIHHEAIADFRDERGATVGMESMTMPFPLAPGVSAEGLAAGDRIAFDFEVRWRGKGRPLAITRIERLPQGTRLGFDEPAPTSVESEESGAAQPVGPTGVESSPQ